MIPTKEKSKTIKTIEEVIGTRTTVKKKPLVVIKDPLPPLQKDGKKRK